MKASNLYKYRMIVNIILWAISIKLVVSHWAVGEFQTPLGQIVNYSCDGVILFSALWGFLYTNTKFLYIYVTAVLTGISYAMSTLFFTDAQPWEILNNHLKIYLPILVFPVLLKVYELEPEPFISAVKKIAILAFILFVYGLIFFPNSMNRLEVWWPSYFGGLHVTAYVLLALVFFVYSMMKLNKISAALAVAAIILLIVCINFGLGVRTAVLAFLVFLLFILKSKIAYEGKFIFKLLPLVALGAVVAFSLIYGIDDKFTSGRFSMYADKYDQLMANGIAQWLLGNGYGSDLIVTDIWWWAAKGAHSDFITMLVEGGVLYFVGFSVVLYRLYMAGSTEFRYVLLAMISTSVFSNGIFVRPLAGYFFMLVLVLLFHRESPFERVR